MSYESDSSSHSSFPRAPDSVTHHGTYNHEAYSSDECDQERSDDYSEENVGGKDTRLMNESQVPRDSQSSRQGSEQSQKYPSDDDLSDENDDNLRENNIDDESSNYIVNSTSSYMNRSRVSSLGSVTSNYQQSLSPLNNNSSFYYEPDGHGNPEEHSDDKETDNEMQNPASFSSVGMPITTKATEDGDASSIVHYSNNSADCEDYLQAQGISSDSRPNNHEIQDNESQSSNLDEPHSKTFSMNAAYNSGDSSSGDELLVNRRTKKKKKLSKKNDKNKKSKNGFQKEAEKEKFCCKC